MSPADVAGVTAVGVVVGVIFFFGLPALTKVWWPFTDKADRMHVGFFLALLAAVFVWWLLQRTTLGSLRKDSRVNLERARWVLRDPPGNARDSGRKIRLLQNHSEFRLSWLIASAIGLRREVGFPGF